MIIRPVLMRVVPRDGLGACPDTPLPGWMGVHDEEVRGQALTGPQRLERQRFCARAALEKCARLCDAPTAGWRQSDERIPIPNGGFHWSISHKRLWAAAVIADSPVGIDIERIAPRNTGLLDEAATPGEWNVVGGRSWPAFFRIWTAKEAALKANGVGIGHLSECRVLGVDARGRMTTSFAGRQWTMEHFQHDGHIAAVTCVGDEVRWHIAD